MGKRYRVRVKNQGGTRRDPHEVVDGRTVVFTGADYNEAKRALKLFESGWTYTGGRWKHLST